MRTFSDARLVATHPHARTCSRRLSRRGGFGAGAKAQFTAHGADAARFCFPFPTPTHDGSDSGTDRARFVRFGAILLSAPPRPRASFSRALYFRSAITARRGRREPGTDVEPMVEAGVPRARCQTRRVALLRTSIQRERHGKRQARRGRHWRKSPPRSRTTASPPPISNGSRAAVPERDAPIRLTGQFIFVVVNAVG